MNFNVLREKNVQPPSHEMVNCDQCSFIQICLKYNMNIKQGTVTILFYKIILK